jgi:hypothetical protein
MLPPYIIEQIRKREREERSRQEQPQLELPKDPPPPRPNPGNRDDEGTERGVIILEL